MTRLTRWRAHLTRDAAYGRLVASELVPRPFRGILLRRWGMTVARDVAVDPGCHFGGTDVEIGERVLIGRGAYVDPSARVTIGAGCSLAMQVTIVTSTHAIGGPERRAGQAVNAPVTIGAGCWLGARCTVLPGVSVAPGCIVAAGAVVAADTRPDGLYGGVPARRLRDVRADEGTPGRDW